MTINSEPVDTVLEEVPEQVVEEGQIVMQQVEMPNTGLEGMVEGQVIMMTNSNGEQQQVVISSAGGGTPLANGTQVIQVQSGVGGQTFMLETSNMKSEPEDLSFSVSRDEGMRHSIDLEAGAQAIQASAATAVQNVVKICRLIFFPLIICENTSRRIIENIPHAFCVS